MSLFKIVETDNFGGDYPDEKFVNLPACTEVTAHKLADDINHYFSGTCMPRYWKVVPADYKLQPGRSLPHTRRRI